MILGVIFLLDFFGFLLTFYLNKNKIQGSDDKKNDVPPKDFVFHL